MTLSSLSSLTNSHHCTLTLMSILNLVPQVQDLAHPIKWFITDVLLTFTKLLLSSFAVVVELTTTNRSISFHKCHQRQTIQVHVESFY